MDWRSRIGSLRSRLGSLRSRNGLIGIAAVLVVAASAAGLYVKLGSPSESVSPSPGSPTPAASVAAPSVPPVGGQTVTQANAVAVLTVVSTSPTSSSAGAATDTAIDLVFNLPVDPTLAQSYFSVLPDVPGTFSQGESPNVVVFTPSAPFGLGSSVSVVLRKGYPSRDGNTLQDDYTFSFTTAASPSSVVFLVRDQVARLANAPSGATVTMTLQFGDGMPSTIQLNTFRATAADLLAAQVHDATGAFLDRPIDTTGMQSVAHADVGIGGTYTVTQPDGVYLLLASDGNTTYGSMWLDFSRFGVLVRQDDQKIVLAGEDQTTRATDPAFDVTFYNLDGGVQPVLTGTFAGTAEFPLAYPATADVAVAKVGGEEVVIPIAIPQTGADIKVIGDLSTQPQIYLTTDRAGYQKGDTVAFAGTVRISNDQAYTVPAGMTVAVWSGFGTEKLIDQTAPVAADGTFSGSFPMPDGVFNTDDTDGEIWLRAGTVDQEAADASPFFTVIATLGNHAPTASLTVSFDKQTYVASDSIVASIAGMDGSGAPLAAKTVELTVYSTGHSSQPSEFDSFASQSTWGQAVLEHVSVQLDANGRATYTFKANVAQTAADQEVTLAARYGTGVAAGVGARTAIVYQAARAVYLLPSRTVYQPGETVIAPFVVETSAGERAANVPLTYEFDRTDYTGSTVTTTVVASGTLTTDANGLGAVRTAYSGQAGDLVLRVKGKDAAGNVFEDARWMTFTDDPGSMASLGSSDVLLQLSVTTDKIAYGIGDEAQLTVTSPIAQDVLVSIERGRIHQYQWISLAQGDNPLPLTISPDLAPGFTVTFSYFRDGQYFTEGLPIRVDNSDSLLMLTVAPDKTSYAPDQTAHVTVTISDSAGAPVAGTLLVDGFDARMSANKLVDEDSIARAFFSPAARGTNGSSSLVGIGSWGGRCGGEAGGLQAAVTNPGQTVLWLTNVTTDANGKAVIDVPIGHESVRVLLFATTSTTSLGQAQLDLNVP